MKTRLFLGTLLVVSICLFAPGTARADDCLGCPYNADPDPMGSGSTSCPTAVDYNSCVRRCSCQYENNKKKCGSSGPCLDVAASEYSACQGNCLTDYTWFRPLDLFERLELGRLA